MRENDRSLQPQPLIPKRRTCKKRQEATDRTAVGRKNWLFAGSDAGGERAAILYSLIATCKWHGIDPFFYLRDVFAKLPDHTPDQLDALLPWTWRADQERQAQAAA